MMNQPEGAAIIYQIQDSIKNEKPTMKDLNRYVIRKYATEWHDIGIELGLDLDVLDIIEKDNPQQSVICFQKTLDKWLKLNADNATWKSLEVALTNVNRANLSLDPLDDVYVKNVISNITSGTQSNLQVPAELMELSDDLCVNYKRNRQRSHEEEWPPDQPSSTVNLALIHYQNRRTQQEVIEISKRCKEGASLVDKLTKSHSNVSKDIHKIFIPEMDNKLCPRCILIEGAPGIGKTVLAREIAYQWANGELLKQYKLLFLLYLRDPKLHKLNSINEILKLFTFEITSSLMKYVKRTRGEDVAFVFDGFDEYPVALQKKSFITDFIKGTITNEKIFLKSLIVLTSRPTATLFLHDRVDRRIEILGFPKEERDDYILMSLKNLHAKKHKLDKYLKQHPIINSLCYIPLHLAILVYLFQQNSLPETLTEMNEFFIINTIYRNLERHKICMPNIVRKLMDLPENVVKFVIQLSQLAFTGLQNNQLVFSLDEIKTVYPEVNSMPGAINGFGLLQAVQHYPERGAGKTISVNFLHFTMQEYLAAFHVSTLSDHRQLSLMKGTFWDGQFNFMWMMYVGIVGVKSNVFKSFVYIYGFDTLYTDKRKCLHLFQCYTEAKSGAKMPREIVSIFPLGEIILNDITLLPHHISSLIFFMSVSSKQQWKTLRLDCCHLSNIGMNSLLEHVIKNDEKMSTLEYVNLSRNESSPWGVYCAIIRQCRINSLTFYGDEGMEKYFQEIMDSLQKNRALKSLALCMHDDHLDDNDIKASTTKEQWSVLCDGRLFFKTQVNNNDEMAQSNDRAVNVKILYDKNSESLPNTITWSNKKVNDDTVCLVTFGLYNNGTVKQLDLSHNRITDNGAMVISNCLKHNSTIQELDISYNMITDDGAVAINSCLKHNNTIQKLDISHNKISGGVICDCLKHNNTLQTLDISHNKISDDGAKCISDSLKYHNNALKEFSLSHNFINLSRMNELSESFQNILSLEHIDLSRNLSSPWGVYCTFIRHCHLNNLTLCGINGIKEHFKEITDSLEINTTLQSLTLCTSISYLNRYKDVTIKSNYVTGGKLFLNTQIKINDDGNAISNGYNRVVNVKIKILYDGNLECSSEVIDLSRKGINDDAVYFMTFGLYNNTEVKDLNLSYNKITDECTVAIADCFRNNCSLQTLILSRNSLTYRGAKKISEIIHINKVKKLDLSHNNISDDGTRAISECLITNTTLQELYLIDNWITSEGAKEIAKAILVNRSLNTLDVSLNDILDKGITYIFDSLSDNNTLSDLNLSQCGISNEGAKVIAKAMQINKTLQNLDLSHNHISEDVNDVISKLVEDHKTLQNLSRKD